MISLRRLRIGDHFLWSSNRPCQLLRAEDVGEIERGLERFVQIMKDRNIKTVVVLLTDEEMQRSYGQSLKDFYSKHGLKVIHYPIEDFSVPTSMESFDKLESTLQEEISKNDILIHCAGGLGRTGMVIAGLAIHKGRSAEEAIQLVRRMRHGSVEERSQEEFLKRYSSSLELKESLYNIFKNIRRSHRPR
jgi:protein-tyrosine phosphatase